MSMEIGNTYADYYVNNQNRRETKLPSKMDQRSEAELKENKSSAHSEAEFNSTSDLLSYLNRKYDAVKNGTVKISAGYLRECLKDEDKRKELFHMLEDADGMVKDAEENVKGYQGMKITIDKDGKMESEIYGGSVVFNEAKRARQLAAAKKPEDVQIVMNLLNKDLSDCQSGLAGGMCDADEVRKVKMMIQRAEKRMHEVTAMKNSEKEEDGIDTFSINLLI